MKPFRIQVTLILLLHVTMCLAYTSYDSLTLSVRDSLEELDQANCSMINIEVSKKIANIDVLESKLRTEKALQCALES